MRSSWLGLPSSFVACGEDEPRTREEFCQEWAQAACSEEVISACQAGGPESCHEAQERFCRELVPQNFSDAHGDECLGAVVAAYEDADLRGEELAPVLVLGGSCEKLIVGPKKKGGAAPPRATAISPPASTA